ncbi:3'-5' exonuclease [Novymonas esmeraldas]|uniref:3'-5' exonuclease n=1 Tax=Novymonas esmeraldas TaxID=1808958 RepID=A0AAW0F4W9_9TRYP
MSNISSRVVAAKHRGVFVDNSAAWTSYGAAIWAEMMATLRRQPQHLRLMGIDAEWFRKSPLAVVQFATSSHCFVLHLSYFDGRRLPIDVTQALCDADIIKCGVGVNGDVTRLQKEQGITIQSVLDVAQYSILFHLHRSPQTNLKALAQNVAQLHIEKDTMVTRSNWELPLSSEQVDYAAEDALASYLIGEAIMKAAFGPADTPANGFRASDWLARTAPRAARELKMLQREAAQAQSERARNRNTEANAGSGGGGGGVSLGGNGAKVRVFDKMDNFLFECSSGRAKFYVMDKGIAEITKHVPNNPRKAVEIRLLFDPKVKTRLCMYDALGACELHSACPFAHGVGELQPEAVSLLESSTPSCACCLGTKGLLRHAITPPSFRKFMPPPHRHPSDSDFLPVCGQCNSALRHMYDEEMKKCYTEAETANAAMFNLNTVAKCSSYARLLQDNAKLACVPESRCDELRCFVREHWRSTFLEDFNPTFEIHEPVERDPEFLRLLGRIIPGDVRAKVTMTILVDGDTEKAQRFNERWRDYCFSTCGVLKKKSNDMSYDDWKAYRAQSGESPGDNDVDGTASECRSTENEQLE